MEALLIIHRRTQPVVVTDLTSFYHFKAIAEFITANCNFIFIVIELAIGVRLLHNGLFQAAAILYITHIIHIIPGCSKS